MSSTYSQLEFVPAITEIAREAGSLLMEYFHRRVAVEYKGEADLVTEADRAAEVLIVRLIRERWTGHDILGEESGSSGSSSDYRWYVDPLDGTTNFAHGFPVFSVSLALEHQGERIAGVVYDPTRQECFSAERGRGAYLNGAPIHVSKTSRVGESLMSTGFPSQKRHKNPNIFFYQHLTMKSHGVRRPGSAALDLCYVASGRFDGFWEFNLNPWDTAAGVLIVQEAAGKVTDFSGGTFRISSEEVLASNGLIHADLLQLFADVFAGRGVEVPANPADYAKRRGR